MAKLDMNSTNKVYKLSKIHDDPRYEGFMSPEGHFLRTFPRRRRSRKWRVFRVGKGWRTPTLGGRVRLFNDYPCVDLGIPAFSERAVKVLRDFLEPNGELLPIRSQDGRKFFAYNVTKVADVLDRRRSLLNYSSDGVTAIGHIITYEFKADSISPLSIFRIPESPSSTYVTDRFVTRASEVGLMGFDFQIVWPLPDGTDWMTIRKGRRKARKTGELPRGQTVKGNSVFIYLNLPGNASQPSKTGVRAIVRVTDELNSQLVDLRSVVPTIGNLEFIDFEKPGVCRLTLSCPDARALVERITSWMKKLKWPGGFRVGTRRHNYADVRRRERTVFVRK
jgi:hypothetical protein